MSPTTAELFVSPDHYLHSFEGDDAVFVSMDRAAYRRSIFLDARISPAAAGSVRVPVAGLLGQGPHPQPMAWIFHVAHCGSTLLARALEEIGNGLVLREPLALRQLALEPDPERLQVVQAMLGKRYPGSGRTLVKANVPVNFILPDVIASDPTAPALFLYLNLRDYCLAILRSEQHRKWLRHVTGLLTSQLAPYASASDGERAAALWSAQMIRFAAALDAMPNARSLDGERLLGSPLQIVVKAARALSWPHEDEAIDALDRNRQFASYSKRPGVPFDNAARLARRATDEAALAGEIAAADAWLARMGTAAPAALSTLKARAIA